MENKEIERKWLMDGFPEIFYVNSLHRIEQGYLSFNPEVRIRKDLTSKIPYRLAIKSDGDLIRSEVQKELTESEYETLKLLVNPDSIVNKLFVAQEYEGIKLEMSKVDNEWYYVEIEFETVEDANNFVPFDWMGKEVTYDKSYKMVNYALSKI